MRGLLIPHMQVPAADTVPVQPNVPQQRHVLGRTRHDVHCGLPLHTRLAVVEGRCVRRGDVLPGGAHVSGAVVSAQHRWSRSTGVIHQPVHALQRRGVRRLCRCVTVYCLCEPHSILGFVPSSPCVSRMALSTANRALPDAFDYAAALSNVNAPLFAEQALMSVSAVPGLPFGRRQRRRGEGLDLVTHCPSTSRHPVQPRTCTSMMNRASTVNQRPTAPSSSTAAVPLPLPLHKTTRPDGVTGRGRV